MIRTTLAALGGVGLIGGVLAVAALADQKPGQLLPHDVPEAVAAGAEIYQAQCASCHASDLGGEPNWRAPKDSGRLPAPPHDETGHTWHHPDPQLFMLTKYGTAAVVGNGYESDMPAFEGTLNDREILQVLAYIKSTWPEGIIARHDQMNAAAAEQAQ
ncbi:MAG: cytochrome c [Salibaculum sp.]|uniref:c-type cytochrome n=1 Tax=Salibaculum sp. TaxID=2855480 RepID=UPI0028707A47|nr:cytochrome c [Salibaculum sp.]MDR9426844.1 cytochrome c [Salibaculum sp.]MDR9481397.1 cytochrome c [Salibaculum sp.]